MEMFTDALQGLLIGIDSSWTLVNILYMSVGIILGLLVGAMPGLNPSTAMAVLIPVTFGMNKLSALIMLTSIYYGGLFGGAFTSILINSPGTSAAVVTAFDGYELTKQGKSRLALNIAVMSSFVGGLVSVIGLLFLAQPLINIALKFGPPEKFLVITMGLLMVSVIGGKSMVKALISVVLGLLFAEVGVDLISGQTRLTFGMINLLDGIPYVAAIMGLFAIAEIFINLETKTDISSSLVKKVIGRGWPTKEQFKRIIPTVSRGSIMGFIVGVIPAAGPGVATWFAYGIEKMISKSKDMFGQGEIKGVAISESSNNGASGGSMVPLLTLGIPGSTATAVLLSAFMLHGLQLGPLLFINHPDISWGIISSMLFGQFATLALCLAIIPVASLILKIPYRMLYPFIIVVVTAGAYSLGYSFYPVVVTFIFGVLGYIMKKTNIPPAPMVLGMVLGPLWESLWKQSLTLSRGSYLIFIQRPISALLFGIILLSIMVRIYLYKRDKSS